MAILRSFTVPGFVISVCAIFGYQINQNIRNQLLGA